MAQRWAGGWGCREEGVQAEVLCKCQGHVVMAPSQAAVDHPTGCMLLKITWVHPSLRLHSMHSLQNRCHQLHFSYLSSMSSKLVFLSYDIHVWSSTTIEKFSVVPPCLLTVNHIMLPTPIFSTLSHSSLSPWETACWILTSLLPWYPCSLPCQSFSFALYHFCALSSFITSLHSDFGFYWTPPNIPVTAAWCTHC